MFHIFYVNQGYMLVLELPALGSIYDLQKCIFDSTNVGVHDQFLFLSGGISLNSTTMLSAIPDVGTDTNPVFLVRRVANIQPESLKVNADGINDLYQGWDLGFDRLERIGSANSSAAISDCIDLGKKGAQVAETIVRFCSNIISEHQFLHQGWMAIIANLDDNMIRIKRRLDKSVGQAEKLETIRHKGFVLLDGFDKILKVLQKIVIPPTLLSPLNSSIVASPSSDLFDSEGEEITLYDWISSKDPAYSLDSLSQHVRDHLEKTNDEDLKQAQFFLNMVQEVAQKSQYRDIGGIDKRLATLNSNLHKLEECLTELREITKIIMQPIIQDNTQNVVFWQKKKLFEMKDKLKNQYDYALGFINSKDELVRNICQRLSTWIRQAYQRLHDVNKRVMCFEEKFSGLHQRLNLTRQIKEAPSIYMAAIPEVMRRELLKREFVAWMDSYIERASAFIAEENRIRQAFYGKLERHFLRQLFTGMDCLIPQFIPPIRPKIDQVLPKISVSHLHELRKLFPEMKELLSVGAPHVFSRLAIKDPNSPTCSSPPPSTGEGLRREESFYVRNKNSNMEAMNQNFPSTNWLSEENIGFSPVGEGANFLAMTQGLATSSSSLRSLGDIELQSPQGLGPLSEKYNSKNESTINFQEANRGSLSPLQPSAPISIHSNTPSNIADPIESIGSNHFSTPEDTFASFGSNDGSKFVNVRHSLPQTKFQYSLKITRPTSILSARDDSNEQVQTRKTDDQSIIKEKDEYESTIQEPVQSTVKTSINLAKKLTHALSDIRILSKDLDALYHDNDQLFKIGKSFLDSVEIKQQIEVYIQIKFEAMLRDQQIIAEEKHNQKLDEIEHNHKIEIEKIKKELEQQRELVAEKERDLKEQQDIVCSINDELASLNRERDGLLMKEKERDETIITSIAVTKKGDGEALFSDSTYPINEASTQELTLAVDSSGSKEVQKVETATLLAPKSDGEDGVVKLATTRSCGTQTRIRNKDMHYFVSLNEVYEGCGALIIWNPQYNAYIARSTFPPNSPYIVKDSSFDKLGIRRPPRPVQFSSDNNATSAITTAAATPRPWMFVFVEHIELCQIRKPANRYNLPLDTRFYRISVVPMPGEFVNSPSLSTVSSVTSPKR